MLKKKKKARKTGTEFPNEKKRKKKNDGKPSLFLFVCIVAFRFKHLDCVVRQIRIHFSYGFDWGVQFFKNHFCGFFVLLQSGFSSCLFRNAFSKVTHLNHSSFNFLCHCDTSFFHLSTLCLKIKIFVEYCAKKINKTCFLAAASITSFIDLWQIYHNQTAEIHVITFGNSFAKNSVRFGFVFDDTSGVLSRAVKAEPNGIYFLKAFVRFCHMFVALTLKLRGKHSGTIIHSSDRKRVFRWHLFLCFNVNEAHYYAFFIKKRAKNVVRNVTCLGGDRSDRFQAIAKYNQTQEEFEKETGLKYDETYVHASDGEHALRGMEPFGNIIDDLHDGRCYSEDMGKRLAKYFAETIDNSEPEVKRDIETILNCADKGSNHFERITDKLEGMGYDLGGEEVEESQEEKSEPEHEETEHSGYDDYDMEL